MNRHLRYQTALSSKKLVVIQLPQDNEKLVIKLNLAMVGTENAIETHGSFSFEKSTYYSPINLGNENPKPEYPDDQKNRVIKQQHRP